MCTAPYTVLVLEFVQLPRLLAVLTVEGGPTYVDKVSHAPSKDLALLYIEEALRDADALRRAGRAGFESGRAFEEFSRIDWEWVKKEVAAIKGIGGARELREALAYISAKALAIAQALQLPPKKGEGGGSENVSSGGA